MRTEPRAGNNWHLEKSSVRLLLLLQMQMWLHSDAVWISLCRDVLLKTSVPLRDGWKMKATKNAPSLICPNAELSLNMNSPLRDLWSALGHTRVQHTYNQKQPGLREFTAGWINASGTRQERAMTPLADSRGQHNRAAVKANPQTSRRRGPTQRWEAPTCTSSEAAHGRSHKQNSSFVQVLKNPHMDRNPESGQGSLWGCRLELRSTHLGPRQNLS